MKSIILLTALITIFYTLGCEKEENSSVKYVFQVLNEQGEVTSTFEEGQDYGYIGCPQETYHAETDTLNTGLYRSIFSSSFFYNNYTSPKKDFSVTFTVQ